MEKKREKHQQGANLKKMQEVLYSGEFKKAEKAAKRKQEYIAPLCQILCLFDITFQGEFDMGRNHIHKNRDKNKQKLPQVPDALKRETDGVYEEYSSELADADDREAQERAKAADNRVKKKNR